MFGRVINEILRSRACACQYGDTRPGRINAGPSSSFLIAHVIAEVGFGHLFRGLGRDSH